jgi:indolepyruvate ferredoxin oxidoreductase alpha subunit
MNEGMSRSLLMGNEAIALGAMRAGVRLVAGYPGTPSTEILETVAKRNDGSVYVEWSTNEKAALEVAAGAAYAGARSMVTMKQVGLNVATDPLMSLAYVGIKGGMVVVVADDPGPISSQTEQDTRQFALYSKLPVFDPVSPEEAYLMIADAFEYSEKYGTPVLFRPTTRVCHGCASVEELPPLPVQEPEGFVRDPARWVIFPRLSYQSHLKIEKRNPLLGDEFSTLPYNHISGAKGAKKGVAAGGVSFQYAMETLDLAEVKLFKVATPHPFPEKLALQFLEGLSEVLVLEELDPVIERALIHIVGKHHLNVNIRGKLSGDTRVAGENSVESVKDDIDRFLGRGSVPVPAPGDSCPALPAAPDLPVRPPVLCAGCPHRASFYAVKAAARGKRAFFTGDIGCYTLGNAAPLDMVDTCLCMGAGITVAQGIGRIDADALLFAFVCDSTFFASGLTGVVNAVYNRSDMILVVLDNSTTAMTGNQPHPGTGRTMMGAQAIPASIPKVLEALGIGLVIEANPLNHKEAVSAVKRAMVGTGVRAIVFKSPCVANIKKEKVCRIDPEKCTSCKSCVKLLGCPALTVEDGRVAIEPALCNGCALCAQICPHKAIGEASV